MALQLNDAYHSIWFIGLSGFLCISLILCSVLRFPSFMGRYRREKDLAAWLRSEGDLGETEVADPESIFTAMHMETPEKFTTEDGKEALASGKNRFGLWGAWICHLGISPQPCVGEDGAGYED